MLCLQPRGISYLTTFLMGTFSMLILTSPIKRHTVIPSSPSHSAIDILCAIMCRRPAIVNMSYKTHPEPLRSAKHKPTNALELSSPLTLSSSSPTCFGATPDRHVWDTRKHNAKLRTAITWPGQSCSYSTMVN
jgi:hypothetical protein